MRLNVSVCFALLGFSSQSFAVLSTDASAALSFYRSSQSVFPSGQISRSTLEDKLKRTEMEISYAVNWDKKDYVLPGDHLLKDIQLSDIVETKTAAQLLSENKSNASSVKSLSPKAQLKILESQPYWTRVQEVATNQIGWIPLHLLQARKEDQGVFVNLIDTYLRLDPRIPSRILTTIPRLHRFKTLGIEKGFVKVQYNNFIGFADINHFASRADFAQIAYTKKDKWQHIAYRENDQLVTKDGKRLPITDIIGYLPFAQRAVVTEPEGLNGPQIRSQVEIKKPEAHIWGVSSIEGHGEVWWKKTDLLLSENTNDSETTITTDELMKREIFSIAFESKNSVKGIVSAEGIYRTEDGINWTKISDFGKQNYPLSIHPNGAYFVGPFKSGDKGKTFEPFIRWDIIAEAIESAYHRNPKILKLTQIESLSQSQVQISVETGLQKVKLRTSLNGTAQWQVVRQ
jgi:hypothetical protein